MVDTGTNPGKAAFAAALAAVGIGVGVLTGWFFHIDIIKSIIPGATTMNPITALGIILAGASIGFSLQGQQRKNQDARIQFIWTARACALLVALIGLLRLATIILGWDSGVDQWLFPLQVENQLPLPSRIAPNVALNFLLLGGALMFVDAKYRPIRLGVEFSVIVVAFGSLLAVLGYAYGVQSFYRLGVFIPMALHTGIAFLILSSAIFLSHTDRGLPAVLAGDSAGGTMARRLMPAVFLLPAGFGWLELHGELTGIFNSGLGNAAFAVANIFVFTFLICWSAQALFHADLERKKAEEVLRKSEEKFHQLADNITDVFWITSPDLKIIHYISAGYKLIWGRSTESLYADPHQWVEAILPEERERVFSIFSTLRENAPEVSVEYRIARPDGAIRWVHDRGFQVRDTAGNIVRLTGIATDITERKRTDETVKRLAAIVEHSDDAIISKTLNGIITSWNPAAEKMFGYAAPEIIGQPLQTLIPPDGLNEQSEILAGFGKGDLVRHLETVGIRKDGQYLEVSATISPIKDPDGRIVGISKIVRDVTARKQAEKALRESNEKFHQLADNITDVFWIRAPDMREVHYVSPAFERIFGRSVESLYANPQQWVDLIFPEDRERVVDGFATLTKNAPNVDMEYRIVRHDGEIRWVHVRGFQVRNAADQLIRLAGIVTDITTRRQTEVELAYERDLLKTLLDNVPDTIYFKDLQSRFVRVSKSKAKKSFASELARHHAAYPAGGLERFPAHLTSLERFSEYLTGKTDFDLVSENTAHEFYEEEQEVIRTGVPLIGKLDRATIQGDKEKWYIVSKIPWRDKDGKIIGTFGITKDITAIKQVEAQLFQSQKMETVGKLAGGIAHEFNSILTAIIGQSELLLGDLPAGSPLAKSATEISKAAGRAATLTRQLLAYGRKQILQPEILDLNSILADMEGALRHLMGRDTDVRMVYAPKLKAVKADVGQIEQVIMNMVINAHDAMAKGGKLTLETANVSFDRESVGRYPELKPGDYVMLAITDTGMGMNADVKARVFEPFFSTKGVGEGAGLGLSTCYGIIKQSGGHISVYSEVARGTTFKIYLPQVESQTKAPLPPFSSPDMPRGVETILLVEDDPSLLEMSATLLKRLGYTVLTAVNGIEALSLKQQRDTGHIDLLFTDVVMPHMSGKELSDRIRAIYPHTKILFTSAYTESAIAHQGILNKGVALLQKPFTPTSLACKLREMLDQTG